MMAHSGRIRAEAASWVARLHGPDRNSEVEAGLKRWLAESPAHATAFEVATDVWQETADLPGGLQQSRRKGGLRPAVFAAAAAITLLVAGAVLLHFNADGLKTAVGEQRTIALEDGTRVELNTNSRVQVKYDEHTRTVILKSGEAFFDVAKLKSRPFVVIAGTRRILALGTTFVVRRDGNDAVSVTLVEGRVAVSQGEEVQELTPGQRLSFDAAGTPALDSPPLERVTAWQRGQLIFEHTPLREAVAEFNRYGATPIRIEAPQAGDIPVGGVFRLGDFLSFAQAVADSHGLRVVRSAEEIVLTREVGGPER